VTSIELRPLHRGEVGGLSRLLWRSFESDPLFRYLFRSRWYAGRVVPLLFRATARDALRHGCIDVAVADRRPLAAAIWSSTGQIRPPRIRWILAELPAYLAVGTLFIDRLSDLRRMIPPATTGPVEPHWYLEFLAVDPDRQGQGVGSRVLAFGLRRADEAGVVCGLKTSSERNLALYRRFGFEVRDELRPFKDGPPIWSMWRPAAALGSAAGPEPGALEASPSIRAKGR